MNHLIFLTIIAINPLISFITVMIRIIVEIRCWGKIGCKNDSCPFRSTCDRTSPSDKERALIIAELNQLAESEEKEKSLNE